MLKTLKMAAAAAVFAASGIAMANAEPLKVGFSPEAYPPFYVADASGAWGGWEVDIVNAVCAEAKFECELVPIPWDGLIPALTTKKIDAIMNSMSITDERKKTIDFSDKYYNTPTAVIGAKGADFTATPEGLKGKILGVQVSTVHAAYAKKHFADAAEIKEYQTQDEANQDLAAGRIDATQADSIALDAFLQSDQGKACCDSEGQRRRGPRNPRPGRRRRPAPGRHRHEGPHQRGHQGDPRQRQIRRDHQEVFCLRHLRRLS